MADYKKLYYALFNAVTDAITALQSAQQASEEAFVAETEAIRSVQAPDDPT